MDSCSLMGGRVSILHDLQHTIPNTQHTKMPRIESNRKRNRKPHVRTSERPAVAPPAVGRSGLTRMAGHGQL